MGTTSVHSMSVVDPTLVFLCGCITSTWFLCVLPHCSVLLTPLECGCGVLVIQYTPGFHFLDNAQLTMHTGVDKVGHPHCVIPSQHGHDQITMFTQCDFCPVLSMSEWTRSNKCGSTVGVTLTLFRQPSVSSSTSAMYSQSLLIQIPVGTSRHVLVTL